MSTEGKYAWSRRLVSLLLCLVTVFALGAASLQTAEAAGSKVKVSTLSYGKRVKGDSYTERNGTYTYQLFKVTVPKAGYLTFQINPNTDSKCKIYKSTKEFLNEDDPNWDSNNCYYYWFRNNKQSQYLIPVAKGTYYIYMSYRYDFSVKFTALSPFGKNFCQAQAQRATMGKTYLINAPFGHTYARWYKLTITKSRTIRITFKDMSGYQYNDGGFYLYDADGKGRRVDKKGDGLYGSTRLPKGTYYICINPDTAVYKFGWK